MHNYRSFGFDFRDKLLSGTVINGGVHIYFDNKEYASIHEFVTDIKPTPEEDKFLTETTNKLLNSR